MKHRLAMVGFGGMAGWHYDLIQRIDDLEVAGIWDIKEERRTYAEGKGIHVYKSEEDLMADPTVDIVLVATPNDVHKGVVIRAMEAGKNAVSEKPVTLCSADLAEMRAAAEKTGKFFTVHQNRRWDEDFLTVKNIMAEGKLVPEVSPVTGDRKKSMAAAWCLTGAYIFWIRRCYYILA